MVHLFFNENSASIYLIILEEGKLKAFGSSGLFSRTYAFYWSHILWISEFFQDSTSMTMTIEIGHSYGDTTIALLNIEISELFIERTFSTTEASYVSQSVWTENIVYYTQDQTM